MGDAHRQTRHGERGDGTLHCGRIGTQVEQRGHCHIAADAGTTVKIEALHSPAPSAPLMACCVSSGDRTVFTRCTLHPERKRSKNLMRSWCFLSSLII